MPSIASPTAGAFGIVLLVLGLAVLVKGGQDLLTAGSLLRSGTVDVLNASDADGTVDLVGGARPHETTLSSPLDDAECLVYEYESKRTIGKDTYRTVDSGQHGAPFLLEDETGSILVDPTDASLELATGVTFGVPEGGAERIDADESEAPAWEFEEVHRAEHGTGLAADLGFTAAKHPSQERYEEFRLDVGESVHLQGQVDADEAGARTGGAVSAAVRKTGKSDLLISDSTKRGTILRKLVGTVLMAWLGAGLVVGAYLLATSGF